MSGPVNGVDVCGCGCKYWIKNRCADCGDTPERKATPMRTKRITITTPTRITMHRDTYDPKSVTLTNLMVEDGPVTAVGRWTHVVLPIDVARTLATDLAAFLADVPTPPTTVG